MTKEVKKQLTVSQAINHLSNLNNDCDKFFEEIESESSVLNYIDGIDKTKKKHVSLMEGWEKEVDPSWLIFCMPYEDKRFGATKITWTAYQTNLKSRGFSKNAIDSCRKVAKGAFEHDVNVGKQLTTRYLDSVASEKQEKEGVVFRVYKTTPTLGGLAKYIADRVGAQIESFTPTKKELQDNSPAYKSWLNMSVKTKDSDILEINKKLLNEKISISRNVIDKKATKSNGNDEFVTVTVTNTVHQFLADSELKEE